MHAFVVAVCCCFYRREEAAMTKIPSRLLLIIPGVLAGLGGAAISAQEKYTVQVPGGLAFSEFKDTKTGRVF
jgi:hypothetical protein